MKLIDIRSALAGAGAVALILGLVSMMQAPTHIPPFEIKGIPTPNSMMRVTEGVPFTVPAGKLFVATGIGGTLNNKDFWVNVVFDGEIVLTAIPTMTPGGVVVASGAGPSIPAIPPGLVADNGTVVEVMDSLTLGKGVLLGYLADA